MKALKINRGRNNYLFGFACVQFGFSEPIIKLTYSNLMTKAHLGIPGGSVSENQIAMEAHLHANSGKKFLQFRERVKIISSKTITLNEILLNSKAPKLMGLLSLDVEGSELNVLMGINHDYFRFQYLLIETNNFHAINQYLIKNEYVFLERLSYHDYIFENAKQDGDL